MRMERLARVEQRLSLGDGVLGAAHDTLRLALHTLRAVRQGPPQPVPRPSVPRPPLRVPVTPLDGTAL
ncbi:hypothetical protein GCM10010344_33290 [Streptomyces bluensis]|nr:hypothetical protein GCM10010344_33290 [Streptomyces bluensis]